MSEQSDEIGGACEQCRRPLGQVGTCCWPTTCGDCEDGNQALLDRIHAHVDATCCGLVYEDFADDGETCPDGAPRSDHRLAGWVVA